jgi:flagellar protein FlbD
MNIPMQEAEVIQLSRLDGQPFFLNPDHVQTLEATPDTVITLNLGQKLVVRESPADVATRILRFRRQVSGADDTAPAER